MMSQTPTPDVSPVPPALLYRQIAASSGTTLLRLSISERGRVDGCTITASSGVAELDRRACKVAVEKGLYLPARDAHGKPVASTKPLRITWRSGD